MKVYKTREHGGFSQSRSHILNLHGFVFLYLKREECSDLIFNCVYLSTLFYSCSIHVFNLVLVLYRISIFVCL